VRAECYVMVLMSTMARLSAPQPFMVNLYFGFLIYFLRFKVQRDHKKISAHQLNPIDT
jgi:hypothetical protein